MNTDKIWQDLQEKDYFLNHRLYNTSEITIPSFVDLNDIENKTLLDIGIGYGRHLAWFSEYANKAYGIDVSQKILDEATKFISFHGDMKKVKLFLSGICKHFNTSLDYVFCRFVFQHISKEQCQEYINLINRCLVIGGKINLQFRLGINVKIEENKEPIVEYTLKEIMKLLKNFETRGKIIGKHIYITGTKIK